MNEQTHSEEEVAEFAQRHSLSLDQARQILNEHGHDESKLAEVMKNIGHFLKAPS